MSRRGVGSRQACVFRVSATWPRGTRFSSENPPRGASDGRTARAGNADPHLCRWASLRLTSSLPASASWCSSFSSAALVYVTAVSKRSRRPRQLTPASRASIGGTNRLCPLVDLTRFRWAVGTIPGNSIEPVRYGTLGFCRASFSRDGGEVCQLYTEPGGDVGPKKMRILTPVPLILLVLLFCLTL